jgi:hypothetical protein
MATVAPIASGNGGEGMRDVLWDSIPAKEKERILSQDHCELDCEFLGFTEVYFYIAEKRLKKG